MRVRLTDEEVRRMRRMRHEPQGKRPTYEQLARTFGIRREQVFRICQGRARVEAGGPMPDRGGDLADEVLPPLFYTGMPVRLCPQGHRYYGPTCFTCYVRRATRRPCYRAAAG